MRKKDMGVVCCTNLQRITPPAVIRDKQLGGSGQPSVTSIPRVGLSGLGIIPPGPMEMAMLVGVSMRKYRRAKSSSSYWVVEETVEACYEI